jgi:hypothetical protein
MDRFLLTSFWVSDLLVSDLLTGCNNPQIPGVWEDGSVNSIEVKETPEIWDPKLPTALAGLRLSTTVI